MAHTIQVHEHVLSSACRNLSGLIPIRGVLTLVSTTEETNVPFGSNHQEDKEQETVIALTAKNALRNQ
jgi:hypothetical protein